MRHLGVTVVMLAWSCATGLGDEAWKPVGLCGGGGMFSLAVSPHEAKVATLSCDMSGAYITRDGGRTWQMFNYAQLKSSVSCSAVFHPTDRSTIYAPSGWYPHLRVSRDGGKTWRVMEGKVPWRSRLRKLAIDPDRPRRLLVGTDRGLFITDSEGGTWRRCRGTTGRVLGLALDRRRRVGGRVYVVGTRDAVYRSTDDGATFRPCRKGLPAGEITGFAGGSDGKTTRLYATVRCGLSGGKLTGGVFTSGDGGASWQSCMGGGLNVQTKRSSKWAHGEVPQYAFALTTDTAPQRAYVFCAGTSYMPPDHCTVYRTDDGGATWRAVLFSDPRFTRFNTDADRLTLGLGQRYQDVPFTMAICPTNPDVVMMAASGYLFRTDNGGTSWRSCHAGIMRGNPAGKNTAWANNGLVVTTTWNYHIDPHAPRRHYICYTDIGLARSLDGGATWIWQGHALPWRNTTYELAFDPAVPGRIWGALANTHDIPNGNIIEGRHRVIMSGGLAVSADYGATWTRTALPEAPAVSVVLDPTSPRGKRTLYASLFERGVYRSIDDGKTWKQASAGLGSPKNMRCCKLHLHTDGSLFVLITAKRESSGAYMLNGVGLYRSTDRGETWTKITASLPLHWVKDFTVQADDSRTILLSAANVRGHAEGGLYRTRDGGATWSKVVQKGPEHFGAFYHPRRPGWIYMTLTEGAPGAGLWLSTDDGKTWKPFTRLPFANIHRVHFDPRDAKRIRVTTFGGSVYHGPIEPVER